MMMLSLCMMLLFFYLSGLSIMFFINVSFDESILFFFFLDVKKMWRHTNNPAHIYIYKHVDR
jgi:hypothetical protein